MPRNQDRGYDLIRFVLTWAIFVHHVLTTAVSCGIPKPYVLNGVFYRLGGGFGRAAVSMFFMLSGALLWRNHQRPEKLFSYYYHRLVKLLVPLWICTIPLVLIDYMKEPAVVCSAYAKGTILYNLLGLDLYLQVFTDVYPYHVCGEWFTSVILTMYLVFPLLALAFRRRPGRVIAVAAVTAVYFLNLKYQILSRGNGWFSFSGGLLFFTAGMLFELHRERLDNNACALAAFAGVAVVSLFFPRAIFGSVFLPNLVASLCLFVLLYRLGGAWRPLLEKPFFARMIDGTCSVSYLIYLSHHFLIMLLMPLLLDAGANTLQFYIFLLAAAALTCGFSRSLLPVVRFSLKRLSLKEKKPG